MARKTKRNKRNKRRRTKRKKGRRRTKKIKKGKKPTIGILTVPLSPNKKFLVYVEIVIYQSLIQDG